MDRQIVYISAIPQDSDILSGQKNAMISDGWVAQGVFGTGTQFVGLGCTPTSPPGLTVNVGPGAVYAQQNIDNSAYGSLAPDTADQIVKIGIAVGTQNFACPAPVTSGQSVVYLIEAAFIETDTGLALLPYYNAANPSQPFSGPNNTGVSQNTVRKDLCQVQVKAGVPANTGSQTIPAPDPGYTALYAVTVANGQTTIVSGNISQITNAPFITENLNQKISQATGDARYAKIASVQNGAYDFGIDSSSTVNLITVNLSPVPAALVQGMTIVVTIANTNSGPTNLNLNSFGNKSVTYKGNALVGGELVAGQNSILSYNGATWNLTSVASTLTSLYTGGTSTGSGNAQVIASVTPAGFTLLYGNIVTFTAGFTNTGATTVNVSGTGVIALKKKGTSGLVDLAAGDLTATETFQIIYDGVFWELFSQSFPAPSTFFQVANNLSEGVAVSMRSNLGLGTAATHAATDFLQSTNNLSDVASAAVAIANLGGPFIKRIKPTLVTSNGTFTADTKAVYTLVKVNGGGAGGSGLGSGGGAGEFAYALFAAATIGTSQSCTIGSAGVSGGNGGNTLFGATPLLSAVGGQTGTENVATVNANMCRGGLGGTGGTQSGSIYAFFRQGQCGEPGFNARYNFILQLGGEGGSSPFGSGGRGSAGSSDSGHTYAEPGLGYGSGGGGDNAGGANNAGTQGVIEIYEFCSA